MRRAFTLLELTVVIALLGLLMAITVPKFAAMRDGASVRAAMADLGGLFSVARQSAITERTMVSVRFDTAAGVVEVRRAGRAIVRHALRTTYGITLGSNRDSTVYDSRGFGYGVSNITVTIRRGSIVDTLTMSRLGRVRW
jgi:prepilin-type N-terminal cleavage/methylation domain-containing protein